MRFQRAFLLIPSILSALAGGEIMADEAWVTHTTFEDFAAGTLGSAGVNLYVAKAGRVEMINRQDYNSDGYLDLFVVNDHNVISGADVLVYWGRKNGPRSLLPELIEQLPRQKLIDEILHRQDAATRLPSDGGGRSLLVDLNNDGYDEIVFCNFKHNYTIYSNALIYWNSRDGFDADNRTELPTILPGGVTAADFNRDGFVDLAFANRGNFEWLSFVEPQGNLESYVYWNGPTGFDTERRTILPTVTAVDCASGDLNGDGYPELVFVNNNFQEKSVAIFWGSQDGFAPQQRDTRPSKNPVAVNLVDVDRDGNLDMILTHKNDVAEVFRGTGDNVENHPWATLPTLGATQCEVGDLNADGFAELVFANKGSQQKPVSFIYWGSATGYAAQRRTELPTLAATDVTLADFNSDGRLDVAFANASDGKSRDVNSYIYWNRPDGFSAADRCEVLGFSPDSANAADLNHDGHQDLVLISHISGRAGEIESFIYWGNPRYNYSPASMTLLPNCTAQGIADYKQDGFVDVVGGYEGDIHYGSPSGFTTEPIIKTNRRAVGSDPTGQPPLEGQGLAVADLNRDGYLDLVMSRGVRHRFMDQGAKPKSTEGLILWGGSSGFNDANKTLLPLETLFSQSVNVADLNKDGFLDLIFPGLETGMTHIFWGAADGSFSEERQARLQAHNASTVEIADLNRDGWLDLIFGGGWDTVNNYARPTRFAMIFWGGRDGYSRQRTQRLESFDSLESSVADLNKDGFLDIVFTNYHAYFTRRVPALIYWGGPQGTYSESRRTTLPAESSSALTIADLNQDSWLDLFVCNHVVNGDHTVGSHIFWGGPQGYAAANRQWVPTFGPHFSNGRDLGNIYDRRLIEEYVSAPLQLPAGTGTSRLEWQATTPHGTEIKFQIRTAQSRQALAQTQWHGPDGVGDRFEKTGMRINAPDPHRWLQYRAEFITPDGGNTPVLEEVTLKP